MASPDIIVVGASMGGVEALHDLVGGLPAELQCAMAVTLHVGPHSVLAKIVARFGPMAATEAVHGEAIRPGHIYIAPPDHHLMLDAEKVRVDHGPRENGHRPSIDPLFHSAAHAFNSRVIGVLLSGALDDGVAGLRAIKQSGGIAVVQDPVEAVNPSMPEHALRLVDVDYCLPAADIARLLVRLCTGKEGERMPPSQRKTSKNAPAAPNDTPAGSSALGREAVSPFTCPECNGTLWESRDKDLESFRCRVGHAYSTDNMDAAQATSVARALWAALRALEERAALERHLAQRAREQARRFSAQRFEESATRTEQQAEQIRAILHEPINSEDEEPDHSGA